MAKRQGVYPHRVIALRSQIHELVEDYEEVSTNDISRWCKLERQIAWRHLNILAKQGVINKVMLPKGIAWTTRAVDTQTKQVYNG